MEDADSGMDEFALTVEAVEEDLLDAAVPAVTVVVESAAAGVGFCAVIVVGLALYAR